jgi:hypothetical protein
MSAIVVEAIADNTLFADKVRSYGGGIDFCPGSWFGVQWVKQQVHGHLRKDHPS